MHEILVDSPEGLSEYALLNRLQAQLELFQGDRRDPVILFRQHFILFHCLYLLQQSLLEQGQASLIISPLEIRLLPFSDASRSQQLASPDSLRHYYLDLTQLDQTGREEVDALLARFWNHLGNQDRRKEALQVLGLSDPVNDTQIQRRYRKLVMQHHPDRGGETSRLQMLNAAISTLLS